MNYTRSITTKGHNTITKEFREKLGLDKLRRVTIHINNKNEIVITPLKDLPEIRVLLGNPSSRDSPSEKEQTIGTQLAKMNSVR